MQRARARYRVSVWTEPSTLSDFKDAVRRYDAICPMVADRLPSALFADAELRTGFIANYGAGVDHIDLQAARRAGVGVSNTPDVLTLATAEMAVMLMLLCSRGAGPAERRLRAGRWAGWSPTDQIGRGLAGQSLGPGRIWRIARATAELARAFGMSILYHSRRRAAVDEERPLDARFMPRLADLLAAADVVSLHCPGERRRII